MPEITRRFFLTAATVALASGAGAAVAADDNSRDQAPPAQSASGRQGNAAVAVSLRNAPDVTAIRYTITHVGSAPDSFTVWLTDQVSGRNSHKRTYSLSPGESAIGQVYGHINHSFVVNVCQSDGNCFTVGPVGSGPSSEDLMARGLTVPARRSAAWH